MSTTTSPSPQQQSQDAPQTSTSHTTELASPESSKCCGKPISTTTTTSTSTPPQPPKHPLDPLTAAEIQHVISVIRRDIGDILEGEGGEQGRKKFRFNTVTLHEPPKAEFLLWQESGGVTPVRRVAEVVAVDRVGGVYDGLVEIDGEEEEGKVLVWECLKGVQPMLTMEDLVATEGWVRRDERVIELCGGLGIGRGMMGGVCCDPWTIGHDERFGNTVRLQQALMYYRPTPNSNQYAFPLDFTPIINTETHEIIHIDIPKVRRPLNLQPSDYTPDSIPGGYRPRSELKPINITQPEGVSFRLNGNSLEWQKWSLHVGFNHREGIVLSNIVYNDNQHDPTHATAGPTIARPIFYRLSLAEMVVPYGNPEFPHHRKHAFDLGEYGAGYMTNSLTLGCDCKGAISYLPFHHVTSSGAAATIPNAVCLHEEDTGILFKHTDFRDGSVVVTRGRKLVVSQVFTAANYEYAIYWSLHLDGTVMLEVKLTGVLNTYPIAEGEETQGWGTRVHPGVNAHNHQHLFCLRINPSIDGYGRTTTVVQVDSERSPVPVGQEGNIYGNGFRARKTRYTTVREAQADYDGSTTRTWDMVNEGKLHPYSGNPVGYKLVSRECPPLLPAEGGLVWKRAGFARRTVFVTRYKDHQLYPAGRHVPQTSGEGWEEADGLPRWVRETAGESVEREDVVLWHTFGVTHFPAPEDFPVMPAEGFSLLLRPRNFFLRNPALDVRPSYVSTSESVRREREEREGGVAVKGANTEGVVDEMSRLAVEAS
ncbi:copper amine oxidase [Peziza echinospora]|nr:copper amine oxidase [Peziza echinospora]